MDVCLPVLSDAMSERLVHIHRKEKGLADVYGDTDPSTDTIIEEECLFMEFLAEMQAEQMPEEGDCAWLEVDSCAAPVPLLPTFSFDFATQLHDLLPERTNSERTSPSFNIAHLQESPNAAHIPTTLFNNCNVSHQHGLHSTLSPAPEPLQYSTDSCNTRMSASQIPGSPPFVPVATQWTQPIVSSASLSFGAQAAGFKHYCVPVLESSAPLCVPPSGGGYNHQASPTYDSPKCSPMAPDTPPLGGFVHHMDPFCTDPSISVQCASPKSEVKSAAVRVFQTRRRKGVFNDHRSETKAERKVRLRRDKNRRNQQAFRDRCRIQTKDLMHLCRSKREELSNKRAHLQQLRSARNTLAHRLASSSDDMNDKSSAVEARLRPGAQRMGAAAGDKVMCLQGSQRSKVSRESSFKAEPHEGVLAAGEAIGGWEDDKKSAFFSHAVEDCEERAAPVKVEAQTSQTFEPLAKQMFSKTQWTGQRRECISQAMNLFQDSNLQLDQSLNLDLKHSWWYRCKTLSSTMYEALMTCQNLLKLSQTMLPSLMTLTSVAATQEGFPERCSVRGIPLKSQEECPDLNVFAPISDHLVDSCVAGGDDIDSPGSVPMDIFAEDLELKPLCTCMMDSNSVVGTPSPLQHSQDTSGASNQDKIPAACTGCGQKRRAPRELPDTQTHSLIQLMNASQQALQTIMNTQNEGEKIISEFVLQFVDLQ